MYTLLQDLRYAVRMLVKSPGFTAVAVITLALGIGANTAIFSIIDAVLLRPLPFTNPDQLVRLYETESAPGRYPLTGPDFIDWKTQNHTFQDMTLIGWPRPQNLSGRGEPVNVLGLPVEANFFSLLGVQPLLGRTFALEEDKRGHERVAVLSYELWQSHFGGDRGVLGRSMDLDGMAFTVIGVMPPQFPNPVMAEKAQVWLPLVMDLQSLDPRGSHNYLAVGRLKPGVSAEQALADVTLIAANLEKQYPSSNYKVGAAMRPVPESLLARSKRSLMLMLWTVALVLLIACANVANLLLSRAVARQREMAVRRALGAERSRLVRQLLTESVLISVLGGAIGLLMAGPCVRLIATAENFGIPSHNTIGLNATVLGFTFALAVLTGVIFGLVPALHISRGDVFDELKGGAGSLVSHGKRRRLASDTLVAAEMALSLLLLVGAGLLLRDFMRLRTGDIGVRTQGVLTAAITLPTTKYPDAVAGFTFSQALLEKVSVLPGVDKAAITDRLPLESSSNGYVHVRGRPYRAMGGPLVNNHAVSRDYFKVMGIPVLQGRELTAEDVSASMALDDRFRAASNAKRQLTPRETNAIVYPVIVNQAAARALWPGQDPMGQMFCRGGQDGPWQQVVGIVADSKQNGLTQAPVPEAFTAYTGDTFVIVTVRSALPAATMVPAIRKAVAQLDATLPLFKVRTMDEIVAEHAGGQRFVAALVGLFAGLALLLAAVGIYGVLSYLVTQRTQEIGIRISLGASRGAVLALVMRHGLRLTAIGVGIGAVGAIAVARVVASVLYEIKPGDPVTLIITPLVLVAVAMLACYLPARRATKVDPMVALRYE